MKKSSLWGVAGAFALVAPIILGLAWWLLLLLWVNAILLFAIAQQYKEQEKNQALRDSYINGRYK